MTTNTLPSLVSSPVMRLPGTHQIDLVLAGRARRLFVARPPGPLPPDSPVLWALDGNALFPLLVALLRLRAARPSDQSRPLPVIVGLGYPTESAYDMQARAEDYTLPGAGANAGQADRFLDGLELLQPWIAHELKLTPASHTLFGHSYGGLLTLYTLFRRPTLFQRYVAASPSIWWGDRVVLKHREAFLQGASAPDARRLLVTAGGLEEGQPHSDPERQQRQRERRQIGSARELVASLAKVTGLSAEFRLLDGEDHGSLVLPSAALALNLAVENSVP